jgi:hypothetical protein
MGVMIFSPRLLQRIWSFLDSNIGLQFLGLILILYKFYKFQSICALFGKFDIIHAFANSFVSDRVRPWHWASFGPRTRILFLTLDLIIFSLFRLTLEQIVNGLYMPLGFSWFISRNDKITLTSRKELDKIWLTIFRFVFDFIYIISFSQFVHCLESST